MVVEKFSVSRSICISEAASVESASRANRYYKRDDKWNLLLLTRWIVLVLTPKASMWCHCISCWKATAHSTISRIQSFANSVHLPHCQRLKKKWDPLEKNRSKDAWSSPTRQECRDSRKRPTEKEEREKNKNKKRTTMWSFRWRDASRFWSNVFFTHIYINPHYLSRFPDLTIYLQLYFLYCK